MGTNKKNNIVSINKYKIGKKTIDGNKFMKVEYNLRTNMI